MFETFRKTISESNKEADIELKVEQIMSIIKSEKLDIHKTEIFSRARLKYQVEMERKLEEVSSHKTDLEVSLNEITSPVDKTKLQHERSRWERIRDAFNIKSSDENKKVA